VKKLFIYCFIFLPFITFGQDFKESMELIREAETKAALNRMLQRVNLNTGNYDVKYHRLEFNVNPSQAFISGDVRQKKT